MRKYLLPEEGNFYKANLHCHSVCSDGKLTPEQLKEAYKAHGYSVLAYTDHDVLLPHHDLTDDSFLALSGFEMEINAPDVDPLGERRCCHICLVALEPDKVVQPMWHRSAYLFAGALAHRDEVVFDPEQPDYVRRYTGEGISEIMRIGRENGFFVTYNHPVWSLEDATNYTNYHGMHAMEIYNHGCYIAGYEEYNGNAYDEMLRGGERIYCISTDDNHNWAPMDSLNNDSFGGFIMIKAPKLEYRTITRALEAGNFYSSEGPEIRSVWFEDGILHVETGPVTRIAFIYNDRANSNALAAPGQFITEASVRVPEHCGYVRISCTDANGRHADTNAYFIDELYGNTDK